MPLFRCPSCHGPLTLTWRDGVRCCDHCNWAVGAADGVVDLVAEPAREAEREYYEQQEYDERAMSTGQGQIASLAQLWTDPSAIERRMLWANLGELRDKRVLLLGNGDSEAELYFVTERPELLIFSDLSVAAVSAVRRRYDLEGYEDRICFAAIDALDLPLFDESIDLVYGSAFVHHLPDVPRFIEEVARVLKPRGRGVFFDDAYAPAWHYSKQTWLKPLMRYTHRRQPISPEDMRFTMSGGFKEVELAESIIAVGGQPWFHRDCFLYYFWTRASDRLFPARLQFLGRQGAIADRLIRLDRRLARFRAVRKNLIRLVWGFDKPEPSSPEGAGTAESRASAREPTGSAASVDI